MSTKPKLPLFGQTAVRSLAPELASENLPAQPTVKGWIQTYTGKRFWPMNPLEADIDIEDIAHALSMQCRFTGHVREFYSVAQHSVLVSELLPENLALWGLLHDASEAYISDISTPVKQTSGMWTYRKVEEDLMRMVAHKYGLVWPMPSLVKKADILMLEVEARSLKAPLLDGWNWSGFPSEMVTIIEPWSWQRAKAEFLLTFASFQEYCSNGVKT